MKNIFAIAAVFALFAASTADAAKFNIVPEGSSPNGVYSIYLDGEGDNGNFDTIIVNLTPNDPAVFANIDEDGADGFTPREPGGEFTYISAFLGAPPAFGGNGHSVLGPVTSAGGIEFTSGPLGMTIDTVNGPNNRAEGLFLANVMLENGGTGVASAQIVSGGQILSTIEAPIGIPEPTTMALAGLSLIGLVASRRRS